MRPIVTTGWLAEHLDDPDLRVLDCHTRSWPTDDGSGHRFEPGREHYDRGHVPGAVLADLPNDLSRRDADLPLTLPGEQQFAEAMGRYGVGEGTRVVLYDASIGLWAARVWWMLRAYGFEDAAVLDGGWYKWKSEGRPTSTEVPRPRPGRFVCRPRPELNASYAEVADAVDGDAVARVVGVLEPDRPAIPGTANVPAVSLVDPETNELLPREQLRGLFADAGLLDAKRVVTYCDAGALASLEALVLTSLGQTDVAVYDGSLAEWNQVRPDEPHGDEQHGDEPER